MSPSALQSAALVTVAVGGQSQAIPFQYNPDTIRRTIEPNVVGGAPGVRSQIVRFAGAASETLTVEAQFSATDAMASQAPSTAQGIAPQLAALALLANPSTTAVAQAQQLLSTGSIEVLPQAADLLLFVWGGRFVLPVQLMSASVTEQFFNSDLWPIRATVSLTMRTLTYSDVDTSSSAYSLYFVYQQGLEQLATGAVSANYPVPGGG